MLWGVLYETGLLSMIRSFETGAVVKATFLYPADSTRTHAIGQGTAQVVSLKGKLVAGFLVPAESILGK